MILIFTSTSITSNLYSKRDILLKNIQKGKNFLNTDYYNQLSWFDKSDFLDDFLEQENLLNEVQFKIDSFGSKYKNFHPLID